MCAELYIVLLHLYEYSFICLLIPYGQRVVGMDQQKRRCICLFKQRPNVLISARQSMNTTDEYRIDTMEQHEGKGEGGLMAHVLIRGIL